MTSFSDIFSSLTTRLARVVMVFGSMGFAMGLCLSAPAKADNQGIMDQQLETMPDASGPNVSDPDAADPDTSGEKKYGFREGSFIVAPIPFSNPTIGAGLVLGAGYLFTTAEGSKPSMIGVGALRSDNGSKGVGVSVNLAFNNNRWLFTSFFAEADVRYDLYTPAGKLPIRQDGVLARMGLAYGLTSQLSFGLGLRYLNTTITPDIAGLPPIPPPFNQFLNVEIASIGLISDWDRRDDTIYPTSGSNIHFEAFHNVAVSGLVQDYDKAYLTYSHYRKLGRSGVLVAHAAVCGASSETPFFDLCGLGTVDAFRGFSSTQFIGQRSVSLQLEYRYQFTRRLGMVGFGGVGQVGTRFSDLDLGGPHFAAGLGARYRVSKKFPVDFAIDMSRNNLGDNQLYIYVGQRF